MESPAAGTPKFIDALLRKKFLRPKPFLDYKHGEDVNGFNLSREGFCKPIICQKKDGLRMQIPPPDFTLRDVVNYSSPSIPIDVIDVALQTDMQLPLGEFVEIFLCKPRERILNVLSFEHSHTRLSNLVQPPHVVKELSLVDNCWPECTEDEEEEDASDRPNVQKYCLMSMGNSYTDFHIDFGGSSVWYHILWGEKIFYVAPPTTENLNAYWTWQSLHDNRRIFLPDTLPRLKNTTNGESVKLPVARVHLRAGETILLPAGWIHAVYTPCDSLVFGGNFLTQIAIPTQLSIYRMEKKCKTEHRFLFPYFEKLHWYAADVILGRLINDLESDQKPTSYQLQGANWLVKFLRHWLNRRLRLPTGERVYFLPARCYLQYTWSTLIDKLERTVKSLTSKARFAKQKERPTPVSNSPFSKRPQKAIVPSDPVSTSSGFTSQSCSYVVLSSQNHPNNMKRRAVDDNSLEYSFCSKMRTHEQSHESDSIKLVGYHNTCHVPEHDGEKIKSKSHCIPDLKESDPSWSMPSASRKRKQHSKSSQLHKKRPMYVPADPAFDYSSEDVPRSKSLL